MFIKRTSRRAAMTLVEVMIAMTVFTIAGGAVMTSYVFGLRSFQALSNYAQLDQQNREAMDTLSREVRQANSVFTFQNGANSSMTIVDGNMQNVTYSFNGTAKTMTRTKGVSSEVILRDCSLIKFNLGMRPPNTNYGYFPTTNINVAKVVDLTWKTSRLLPGGVANTENIQTARIVIRKQKVSQ
jgi:type II secretory pathway pseudopilin PulG